MTCKNNSFEMNYRINPFESYCKKLKEVFCVIEFGKSVIWFAALLCQTLHGGAYLGSSGFIHNVSSVYNLKEIVGIEKSGYG